MDWRIFSRQRLVLWSKRLAADARRRILVAPFKPEPQKWREDQLTFAWLGHSSVLINFYGITILTDPVLFSRVGIGIGLGTLGPKRYIAPALSVKELPSIDVVLLSHAHYDHMDLPTLRRLRPRPWVATATATRDVLGKAGLKDIAELNWGETATFENRRGTLEVAAFQVKHWGERPPSSIERGYNGYILRRNGRCIFFGGDTAMTPHFASLRSDGPYAVAIMPIGAYRPWIRNHCTPEEAVQMADAAGANYILPVHHQTFRLSEEPMREPIERLASALARSPERLGWREVGETFVCS